MHVGRCIKKEYNLCQTKIRRYRRRSRRRKTGYKKKNQSSRRREEETNEPWRKRSNKKNMKGKEEIRKIKVSALRAERYSKALGARAHKKLCPFPSHVQTSLFLPLSLSSFSTTLPYIFTRSLSHLASLVPPLPLGPATLFCPLVFFFLIFFFSWPSIATQEELERKSSTDDRGAGKNDAYRGGNTATASRQFPLPVPLLPLVSDFLSVVIESWRTLTL